MSRGAPARALHTRPMLHSDRLSSVRAPSFKACRRMQPSTAVGVHAAFALITWWLDTFPLLPVSVAHAVALFISLCHRLFLSAQHIKSDYNDPNMPWDFTPENYSRIESVLAKYPPEYRASGIMPILDLAQRQNDNWIPLAAMNKIAQILECAPMRVYEVASFYTMYNREPVGRFFIQLCGTTPCQLCGAELIKQSIMDHLDIHDGRKSAAWAFHLSCPTMCESGQPTTPCS